MAKGLKAALENEANREALVATALRTPFNALASFLGYAETCLPELAKGLTAALEEDEGATQLAKSAIEESPSALVALLEKQPAISRMMLTKIDTARWNQVRSRGNPGSPGSFPKLAKALEKGGRLELAVPIAQRLIEVADTEAWGGTGIGLGHLSHVLRLGCEADAAALQRFLDTVVTDSWLTQQYRNVEVTPGSIAACLFSVWGYHGPRVARTFVNEGLQSRLSQEMAQLQPGVPLPLSASLQLLGCSALVEVRCNATKARWPSHQQLAELLRVTAPEASRDSLGTVQMQLWLGLRQMARLCRGRVVVPGNSGDQILTLWQSSAGWTEFHVRLNAWMVSWLDKCAVVNWTLLQDTTGMSH